MAGIFLGVLGKRGAIIWLLGTLALNGVVGCGGGRGDVADDAATPKVTSRMHERSLRDAALSAVQPAYPSNSTACGVGVAQFELDANGRVLALRILQAPDKESRDLLASALHSWKFGEVGFPEDLQRGVIFTGKVTFYFVNLAGSPGDGHVVSGTDAPNISTCVWSKFRDEARTTSFSTIAPQKIGV